MPKEFENTSELRGARFTRVDLSGARFRDVDLRDAKVVDAFLMGARLSGLIDGLRINDVEVAPLIEAELDRRHPERAQLRASDPDGLRAAWALIEQMWASTLERARGLSEAQLQERVDEEWSFVETLRHLIFVTDAWVGRTIRAAPHPYHPWALPQSGLAHPAELGIDVSAKPTLDEVLPIRFGRMVVVRQLFDDLTEAELARTCDANPVPGYPADTEHRVGACLGVLLDEEWSHHQYAARDLTELELRPGSPS